MKTKTRKTRNRFLVCFRPASSESDEDHPTPRPKPKSPAGERVLNYISVASGDLIPTILSTEKPDASDAVHRHRPSRILACILRPIVSKALPRMKDRKLCDGKVRQDPLQPKTSSETVVSAQIEKLSCVSDEKPVPETCDDEREIKSAAVQMENRSRNYNYAMVVCSMVVGLSVLVTWGRLCAIVCTSTCLWCIPRRQSEFASR